MTKNCYGTKDNLPSVYDWHGELCFTPCMVYKRIYGTDSEVQSMRMASEQLHCHVELQKKKLDALRLAPEINPVSKSYERELSHAGGQLQNHSEHGGHVMVCNLAKDCALEEERKLYWTNRLNLPLVASTPYDLIELHLDESRRSF